VAGKEPKWLPPQMVTDLSSNRAQSRATTLIETNVLPLSQTANQLYVHMLIFYLFNMISNEQQWLGS